LSLQPGICAPSVHIVRIPYQNVLSSLFELTNSCAEDVTSATFRDAPVNARNLLIGVHATIPDSFTP